MAMMTQYVEYSKNFPNLFTETAADDFKRQVGILEAGQLEHDFVCALTGDDRFLNTELIDAIADRFQSFCRRNIIEFNTRLAAD